MLTVKTLGAEHHCMQQPQIQNLDVSLCCYERELSQTFLVAHEEIAELHFM